MVTANGTCKIGNLPFLLIIKIFDVSNNHVGYYQIQVTLAWPGMSTIKTTTVQTESD